MLNADLVQQLANELFRVTPPDVPEAVAQDRACQPAGGGPLAPFATGVPALDTVPLDVVLQPAPELPAVGSGPSFPASSTFLRSMPCCPALRRAVNLALPITGVAPSAPHLRCCAHAE